jgi:hypothetical protein
MNEYRPLQWEVFILRLRRETTEEVWQGEVIHLPDRESLRFINLAQAMDFIRDFTTDPGSKDETFDASRE